MNQPASVINAYRKTLYRHDSLPAMVNTVCEQARCPNRGECFAHKTVTFLLLGSNCSRNCRFCGVSHGNLADPPVSSQEIAGILKTIEQFKLRYVVLTSVTRDDLPDGGASAFVETMQAIHRLDSTISIEVLTPDFKGNWSAIEAVCNQHPVVFNHNLEVVPRIFPAIRAQGNFMQSLEILRRVKQTFAPVLTKTGFMVGIGETNEEVHELLHLIASNGIDRVTIGQYLRPTRRQIPVARYVSAREFESFAHLGRQLGLSIQAGPLVRSSYRAGEKPVVEACESSRIRL